MRSERRRLHPLTLVFSTLRIARAMVLPALLAVFGTTQDDFQRRIALGFAILAGPALIAAIGRYASFRFRLGTDELAVESGIVQRNRRIIPFDRIQNVDVRQTWLERLAGVAEVRVETAGGERTEAILAVLGRADADALRAELLRRGPSSGAAHPEAPVPRAPDWPVDLRSGAPGRAEPGTPAPPTSADASPAPEPPIRTVAQLRSRDLALAGATANEIGLVTAALLGGLQLLDDLARRLPLLDIDTRGLLPEDGGPAGVFLAIVSVIASLVLIGWAISVVAAVVGYHDFTLERAAGELRKRYGLLDRREASIPIRRVQAIRVEESLLRRPLGLCTLKVETAGGSPGQRQRGGAEAFLPLARRGAVPAIVGAVFDDLDFDRFRFRRVHARARRRVFLRLVAPITVAAAIAVALPAGGPHWGALLLLGAPAWLLAGRFYRHRGYAHQPGYVAARAGFFNRVTWIIPDRKIQTLHIVQTPFQRMAGLATLLIDTAGGRGEAKIADLGWQEAEELLETLAGRAGDVGGLTPNL